MKVIVLVAGVSAAIALLAAPAPPVQVPVPQPFVVEAEGNRTYVRKVERCTSARRGVAFYIRSERRWARLSYQPRPRHRDRGRTCAEARRDVIVIRAESRKARLVYRLWLATPKLAGETPWHTSRANPVNQNLYRLGSCETGGKPGQNGVPDWDHRNSTYCGALGFAWSTWLHYRHRVTPLPPPDAARATPAEQLAVGRALVREFSGYSSWPACHVRLGLG